MYLFVLTSIAHFQVKETWGEGKRCRPAMERTSRGIHCHGPTNEWGPGLSDSTRLGMDLTGVWLQRQDGKPISLKITPHSTTTFYHHINTIICHPLTLTVRCDLDPCSTTTYLILMLMLASIDFMALFPHGSATPCAIPLVFSGTWITPSGTLRQSPTCQPRETNTRCRAYLHKEWTVWMVGG